MHGKIDTAREALGYDHYWQIVLNWSRDMGTIKKLSIQEMHTLTERLQSITATALSAINPERGNNEALVEKVITFFNNRLTIGETEDECGDLVSVLELDKDFRADLEKMFSAIDPEAIRVEARAELAKKIIEWPEPGMFSSPYEGEAKTYWEIVEYCEAILTDDPKEREAEVGDIVAWVNSTGDVIFGQFGKEITQGDAVILVRRDEVERKLKGAEV